MPISREEVDRLKEIKDKMLELLDEAKHIVKWSGDQHQVERMRAYWHPHIQMGLTEEHDYMGNGGASLEQCIDALESRVEPDPDEYVEVNDDGATYRYFTSDGLIQKVYDDGEDEWIPGEAEYDALKAKHFANVEDE